MSESDDPEKKAESNHEIDSNPTLLQLCREESSFQAEGSSNTSRVQQWLDDHSDEEISEALKETNKYGYTVLHYAAEHNPSVDVITKLLDAGGEKLVMMTTDSGITALHNAASKNASVEIISKLLDAGGEKLVMMTTASGWTALHYAASENASVDIISKLIDAGGAKLVSMTEQFEWTALHYAALENPSVDVISKLLDTGGEKLVTMKSIHGWTALHLAAEHNSFEDAKDIMRKLVDEGGEELVKMNYGTTPLHASKFVRYSIDGYDHGQVPEVKNYWKFLEENSKFEKCVEKFNHDFKQHLASEYLQRAVLENLDSKFIQRWLNKMSCDRRLVAFIMMELYLHCGIITCYLRATSSFLTEKDSAGKNQFAVATLSLCAFFFGIEIFQMYQNRSNIVQNYVFEVWNFIDLTAIALAVASSIKLIREDPSNMIETAPREITSEMRYLLMATGFFLFVHFVSYLKKTFLPFALFVSGLISIVINLVPFLVISGITLYAFAYMYFVQRHDDEESEGGYATLTDAFLSTFQAFVGGPDGTTNLLDILFGLVIVVILLNVVIAIVSSAWEEATDSKRVRERFWKYRVPFILDVAGDGKPMDWETYLRLDYVQCLGLVTTISQELDAGLIMGTLYSVVFPILGLVSFGQAWPLFVREYLFTIKLEEYDEKSTDKVIDELEKIFDSKMDELKRDNEELKSLMMELLAKSKASAEN